MTKKLARKSVRKSAPKSASKRVPKKAVTKQPRADKRVLNNATKNVQQTGKELQSLMQRLSSAGRSVSNSRKPDSIKQAKKVYRQLEKETKQQQKNFKNNVNALDKLVDVFRSKGKAVKPSIKAAATKAKKIVQVTTPIVKRVPKKVVPKKSVKKSTPKKTSTKAAKKATKSVAKKATKTVAKKATLPAHVIARASEYKKPHPVPKPVVLAVREGEDYNYPLATNEHTSVMVKGRLSELHLYDTLEDAVEAADTYADDAQAETQIVTIAFKPKSTSVQSQMRSIKAAERRKVKAHFKERDAAKDKLIKEQARRIKQLEKESGFKRDKEAK